MKRDMVFTYLLGPCRAELVEITIPGGFRLLKAISITRDGDMCLDVIIWVEVYSKAELVTAYFMKIGTGEPIPDGYEYFDTVMSSDERAFHIYWK